MPRELELTGQTFGELTAIERGERTPSGYKWRCSCSCGQSVYVPGARLVSGHTQSCGHLRSNGRPKTHGDTESREYRIWTDMRQRCSNPKRPAYYRYGGRGITVCERWNNSYEAFLEDMGRTPFAGAQIDRIDNNGNYEPGNCRWATQKENMRNKEVTRHLEYGGRRMPLVVWAEELGVPARLLAVRAGRGWTDEEIVTGNRSNAHQPPKTARWITHDGETRTLSEWARHLGIPMKKLHCRLSRGWSMAKVMEVTNRKGDRNATLDSAASI